MPRKTFALAVIDSGGANIGSVCYALERLGVTPELVSDPKRLALAERASLRHRRRTARTRSCSRRCAA